MKSGQSRSLMSRNLQLISFSTRASGNVSCEDAVDGSGLWLGWLQQAFCFKTVFKFKNKKFTTHNQAAKRSVLASQNKTEAKQNDSQCQAPKQIVKQTQHTSKHLWLTKTSFRIRNLQRFAQLGCAATLTCIVQPSNNKRSIVHVPRRLVNCQSRADWASR